MSPDFQIEINFRVLEDSSVAEVLLDHDLQDYEKKAHIIALSNIKNGPKWKPAMLNSKPIDYTVRLPIRLCF